MVDGEKLSGDAKRDRKHALEAKHDYKSAPHDASPVVSKVDEVPSGDRKRERKQALTPSTLDPLQKKESKALGSPGTISPAHPATDVEAWLDKVPDGSVVKINDVKLEADVYRAASKLGKVVHVAFRPKQPVPLKWQVKG